jgi:prolyl 4-hydroxylase
VISRIEKRISHVSFLPVENGEGIQILRYENGQKYEPHWDFFFDKVNSDPRTGGQRIATMLMYL